MNWIKFLQKPFTNTHDVVLNKINIPLKNTVTKDRLRILQLSDLHLEHLSLSPETLAGWLRNQSFDLLALTGDYLDRPRTLTRLSPYLQVLRRFQPKYGTFAVFGNHDYCLDQAHFKRLCKKLQNAGIQLLFNESRTLKTADGPLHMIGIDDPSTDRDHLQKAFANVPEKGTRIVLSHDPNIVLKMEDVHYDYCMAGHFHGGQIHWPKPYHLKKMGKLARMGIYKGLHFLHGKPFYINEGLGQTGLNIRIKSRPEITLHEFVGAKNHSPLESTAVS